MADFMLYWIPGTFDTLLRSGRPLDHLGSNHFHRVRSGDTVWIVTVRSGSLRLVGRLCVELVVDTAEARQILGTDDLWAAGYQAIALSGTEAPLRELSLDSVAPFLRFESPTGRDRLTLSDGYVPAQQLQTMRRLTAESATLLQSIWASPG